MSNFVAVIKSLVGQVFVVSLDGLKRQVFEGERLFQGDQVVTASGGSAILELTNGDVVDIAANGNWQAGEQQTAEPAQAAQAPASELEQAIAAGFDPTADLEPTAAGPGAAGGSGGAAGGGHSFVMLDETAEQLDPAIGFITQGLSFPTETPIEEQNVNPELNITSTGTPPTISIPDTDGNTSATDSTLPESAGATAGSFTVSAEAGIASISVDGTTLTLAQLNDLVANPAAAIDTGEGSLKITSFNAATGVVSYSYDPSVLSHTNSAAIVDSIVINVLDSNNVSRSDSLDILISDTAPVANADTRTVSEDDTGISGNLVTGVNATADTQGADTA
ncbi:MAG: retention module-containing protein, partial [Pseudomonas sp.]|uniref:retention module-containing protein n=1 Tax=Pseudomonas sp. TaxID=306 RepID=UPI00299D9B6D